MPNLPRGVSVNLLSAVLFAISDQMALNGRDSLISQDALNELTQTPGTLEAESAPLTEQQLEKALAKTRRRLEEQLESVKERQKETARSSRTPRA